MKISWLVVLIFNIWHFIYFLLIFLKATKPTAPNIIVMNRPFILVTPFGKSKFKLFTCRVKASYTYYTHLSSILKIRILFYASLINNINHTYAISMILKQSACAICN